jgi:predicted transcriptional regulator of viral defense system
LTLSGVIKNIQALKPTLQQVVELARNRIIRSRELEDLGVPRARLGDLVAEGKLIRIGRGLYTASDFPITADHSLALAAKRYPEAVVCLLSAAQFHGITQEMPAAVWMAVPRSARVPSPSDFQLRAVRVANDLFPFGIEEHDVEGTPVKIYSVARTVADCFKFRNRLGISVAVDVLQIVRFKRAATADQLWDAAKACRVLNVMRPYFEAIQ